MKEKEFKEKMDEIQEKIGQDASNLILDDIATLITDNQNMNKELESKDEQIGNLKKTNETLQTVNGNLLQQVAMGDDTNTKNPEEENKKKEPFDFRTCFDEKGNFKR